MPIEKRAAFNDSAETYDRIRNHYPEQLFADLFQMAQLPPAARVLEIGPGTGFATLQVAQRGHHVVGVELGTEMARVARHKLAAFPNVEINVAAFEEWAPPLEPFDLVLAATSFHWLDPDVRYTKTASVLRPGGVLAIVHYRHVAGGSEEFFDQAQACYERFMPRATPQFRLPKVEEIEPETEELMACGLFDPPQTRTYITEETYTSDQYIDLLTTYPDHLTLEPEDRDQLFDCVRTLIDHQYGGRIVKRYLNTLMLSRR